MNVIIKVMIKLKRVINTHLREAVKRVELLHVPTVVSMRQQPQDMRRMETKIISLRLLYFERVNNANPPKKK